MYTSQECKELSSWGQLLNESVQRADTEATFRNGSQWYINQNQFFRQIRNFEFDLRDMPLKTDDEGQPLVPTGIHWQVSQATSLQNLKFTMPTGKNASHVGIFTENGSGGFVSGRFPRRTCLSPSSGP